MRSAKANTAAFNTWSTLYWSWNAPPSPTSSSHRGTSLKSGSGFIPIKLRNFNWNRNFVFHTELSSAPSGRVTAFTRNCSKWQRCPFKWSNPSCWFPSAFYSGSLEYRTDQFTANLMALPSNRSTNQNKISSFRLYISTALSLFSLF